LAESITDGAAVGHHQAFISEDSGMTNALATVSNFVAEARGQFEAVNADRSLNFEREAGFATQALMAQDYTLQTALKNPQSVINAVGNIAAVGLSLNPAKKQAYLVPRDGKICLDISYIGLLDLAIASGSIRWGQAELAYSSDRFVLNGFDKPPTHERDPFAKDRGEVIGAYVVVKTYDGDYLTTTMQIDEILSIRDRSSAWKNGGKGPWKTDPGEMMKKTVIKRAYKLWPKTDRLDTAIHHLNVDGEEGLEPIDNEPVSHAKNYGLSPARYKVVREVANEALQLFDQGDEMGAYGSASGITDSEEMIVLWNILKPHSALRSCIKRLAREEREKQTVIDQTATAAESGEQ
jgi:recombination protein RecT